MEAMDAFTIFFEKYLDVLTGKGRSNDPQSREQLLDEVGKEVGISIDPRQYDRFLARLHEEGQFRIYPRIHGKLSSELERKLKGSRPLKVTVSSGTTTDDANAPTVADRLFNRIAAYKFITRIYEIGQQKDQEVHIGIVSGRTTRRVIDAVCELDWWTDVGVDATKLPKIVIVACNHSLTSAEQLPGNATVLVYRLMAKINSEAHAEKARAWGFSAPFAIDKTALQDTDSKLETKAVLKITEPCRVDPKVSATETLLDIILTGVGDRPVDGGASHKGSIFYKIAEDAGFDLNALSKAGYCGDFAFTPIATDGSEVQLSKDGKEFMFYSAIRLKIPEAMSKDPNKEVMLVATQAQKSHAILASIGVCNSGRRYASHLICDESTAQSISMMIF